jgi:hypothetical protein
LILAVGRDFPVGRADRELFVFALMRRDYVQPFSHTRLNYRLAEQWCGAKLIRCK